MGTVSQSEAKQGAHDRASPEYLRRVLSYDPATGRLTWLPRTVEMFVSDRTFKNPAYVCAAWNAKHAGKEGFTTDSHGYRIGRLGGHTLKAHRVAWAIHHGEWPAGVIDHINGDPADNRISNLRDVSHSVNMRNSAPRSDNKSGYAGIHWCKRSRKWIVGLQLGRFKSLEEAVAVRDAARNSLDMGHTGRSDHVAGDRE